MRRIILAVCAVGLALSTWSPAVAAPPSCESTYVSDPVGDPRRFTELCRLEAVQWDHTFRLRWERASIADAEMKIFSPQGQVKLAATCEISPAFTSCATLGQTSRTWHYEGQTRSLFHVTGDFPAGSTIVLSARPFRGVGAGAGEFEIAGY